MDVGRDFTAEEQLPNRVGRQPAGQQKGERSQEFGPIKCSSH